MTPTSSLLADDLVYSPVRRPRLALEGGAPVRSRPWPSYDKGDVFINPEDEAAAIAAIRSHLYFRYDFRDQADTACGRLERRAADWFGTRHALAVSSGTAAIALALMAAGIPKGAKVVVPGFTFAATPSAVVLAGCEPYLVECDADLNFDLDDLRRRWRDDIAAILVVHMRGVASDMPAICDFAAERGIPVIEDAVPAMGAELDGRKLGTFGLAGCFSTQSDKSINTGEGGLLVTDDSDLYARAIVLAGAYEGRMRRHFPEDRRAGLPSDLELPLLSMRMDEIRAALAEAQFDRLGIRLADFTRNYDAICEALERVPGIRLRRSPSPGAALGDSLVFMVEEGDPARFAAALRAEGIGARLLGAPDDTNVRVFWNWRFLFPGEDPSAIKLRLPAAAAVLQRAIDVPLASTLTAADIVDLVTAVRKVAAAGA